MMMTGLDQQVVALPTATVRTAGPGLEAGLACLSGPSLVGLASRFHWWRGASGARYTVTVFSADDLPDHDAAVLIGVSIRSGKHRPIGLVAIEPEAGWAQAFRSMAGKVDEWHVHLLARDSAARAAVVRDLAPCLGLHALAGAA